MTSSASTNSKKNPLKQHISFSSDRRFGIELELNSFDGQNRPPKNEQPAGIADIASIVSGASPDSGCEIRAWEHTNNNRRWVAKPDSSCGLEVVSPPRKGWKGLKDCIQVVDALAADPRIKSDSRCSVHVHLEIADLSETDLASIVAWWIKCEPVIMDAMPLQRKRNRYCQLIGMNNSFHHDANYSDRDLIQRVGDVKYYSFNTHQYIQSGRKTVEFRTIEGAGCRDAYLVKQWVRFLIHFVDTAVKVGRPKPFFEGKSDEEKKEMTPWTGQCWLNPEHALSFLGFNNVVSSIPDLRKPTEFTLSKGMQQTRDWFLARMLKYISRHKPGGMRFIAYQQLEQIIARDTELRGSFDPDDFLSPTELRAERLFGDDYRY